MKKKNAPVGVFTNREKKDPLFIVCEKTNDGRGMLEKKETPPLVFSPTEKRKTFFSSFVKTQTMAEEKTNRWQENDRKKGNAPIGVFTNGENDAPPFLFSPTEK